MFNNNFFYAAQNDDLSLALVGAKLAFYREFVYKSNQSRKIALDYLFITSNKYFL